MKITTIILGCVFISGCASISVSDLSKDPRFSEYIGNKYFLKNNALLCKDGYLGDAPSSAPEGNQLILKETANN